MAILPGRTVRAAWRTEQSKRLTLRQGKQGQATLVENPVGAAECGKKNDYSVAWEVPKVCWREHEKGSCLLPRWFRPGDRVRPLQQSSLVPRPAAETDCGFLLGFSALCFSASRTGFACAFANWNEEQEVT